MQCPKIKIFNPGTRNRLDQPPKIMCSKPPIVMGNFNGNILAQKNAIKGKRPDFQALNTTERATVQFSEHALAKILVIGKIISSISLKTPICVLSTVFYYSKNNLCFGELPKIQPQIV